MKITSILKYLVKAERTGNFHLHLQSVQEMLTILAAAGHNNYTKPALLYVQQMLELKTTHHFMSSSPKVTMYYIVRRTYQLCARILTDLGIEQILMNSAKATG